MKVAIVLSTLRQILPMQSTPSEHDGAVSIVLVSRWQKLEMGIQ